MKWTDVLNPELIKAAATSPLAILALMILVLCVVVLAFFSRKTAPVWAQLTIVLAFLGGVGMFAWGVIGAAGALQEAPRANALRLNVYFEPPTDPNDACSEVKAFVRGSSGEKPTNIVRCRVNPGRSLSLWIEVPDGDTPFYAEIGTPRGVWRTDEYSIYEPTTVAKQVLLP